MSINTRSGWKILTHDLRSPIQGGEPVFVGELPTTLAAVALDTSGVECGAGWNYSADLATAFGIAGLWPNGRPSRAFLVEASDDAIERGDKRRASSLTLVREASDAEIRDGVAAFSARYFGAHTERMTTEQLEWRRALARPRREPAAVSAHLQTAVVTRGLSWSLKEYDSCKAAWDARAAWDVRAARAARAAWAAWAALEVCFAAVNARIKEPPEYLTAGMRDAFENGLGVALPVAKDVLGWAMDVPEGHADHPGDTGRRP